jgi:hypothetical protein
VAKLTFSDLISAAQSPDANTRKEAYAAFLAWAKAAPQLEPDQRLTYVERSVLMSLFKTKGFGGQPRQPQRPPWRQR